MIELREKAKTLQPIVRVGKNGLSESTIKEIQCHLKKRKLIKIKFLQSAISQKKRVALKDEVLNATGAELVDFIGNVIAIYKK